MESIIRPWKAGLKAVIRALFFRPGWYQSNYQVLERLFRHIPDPWNFESSPYEKDRMDLLEEFVRRYPHGSILEIGCAEGIFTQRLQNLSQHVTAIDVSPTAIARAQKRCPGVRFIETGIEDYTPDTMFDLVICSETLYYVKHVEAVVEKLSHMGRYCLVSYLNRESKNLDHLMQQRPLLEFKEFQKTYGLVRYSMSIAVWKTDIG